MRLLVACHSMLWRNIGKQGPFKLLLVAVLPGQQLPHVRHLVHVLSTCTTRTGHTDSRAGCVRACLRVRVCERVGMMQMCTGPAGARRERKPGRPQ